MSSSRPTHVATAVFTLAALADGALMPFFALWAVHEVGVPASLTGVLLACYAGGELLATPFVGGLADRLGRRPVLFAATAGVGTGFLLLSAAPGAWTAAAALLLIGVFESTLHPTASAVLADAAEPGQLPRLFARARTGSALGHVAGPLAGAWLAGHSLGLVFAASGAALLLAALLVAVLLPETSPAAAPASGHDEEDDDLTALIAVFRNRSLAALLLPVLAAEVASSWINSVLPLHAVDAELLDASGVGVLFAAAAALEALLQLPMSRWTQRLHPARTVIASGLASAAAFAALLALPGLSGPVAAVVLATVASVLAGPLIPTLVAERAPPHARATCLAALSSVSDLRDAVGPATGTLLYAAAPVLPWIVALLLTAPAALRLARVTRHHRATTTTLERRSD